MIIKSIYNPEAEEVAEVFQINVTEAEAMLREPYVSYDEIIGNNQVFLTSNADDPGDVKTLIVDSIINLSKDQRK